MTDYSQIIDAAGKKFNVDPRLIAAVIQTESSGDPNAVSPAGAIGLGQIMPATAKALGIDPTDPAQNIMGTAQVLSQNLAQYGNVPDALRAYNAGNPSRWNNPETQAYVGKVAAAYGSAAPEAPGAMDLAANGASDVPLVSAGSSTFDKMFPTLAGSPGVSSASSASAFDRLYPGLNGAQPAAPAAAAGSEKPGFFANLGAGVVRGVNDVGNTLDNVSAWIDKNVPGAQAVDTAVSNLTGGAVGATPQAMQQTLQQNAADRQAFNQQYGDSIGAQLGRVAGNVVATAPAIAAGGPVLSAAGDATGVGSVLSNATSAVRSIPLVGRLLAGGGQAAAAGALSGGTAGALASGGNDQSVGQGALQGTELGAALGPVASAIGSGVGYVGKALTGGTVAPARASLADLAVRKYGIPLTAPEISGNPATKFLSSAADALGGGGESRIEGQREAFTQAVGRTFGANSTHLTPDVMQASKDSLGQQFDNIAARSTINADQQFLNDLIGVQSDAAKVLPVSEQGPINSQIDDLLSAVNGNAQIDGKSYQALVAKGAPLDRLAGSKDPNIAYYAQQIRGALDDALQRSLAASGQSDLAAQLQQTRLQYKNLMTVAPLAAKAEASGGVISPTLLQGAVQSNFKNRAFQGAGDLGELAAIGQTFLKPTQSSGTTERFIGAERILHGLGGIGAVLAGHPAEGAMALGSIPAQIVGGRIVGAGLNSRRAADMLLARSLAGPAQGQGWATGLLSGAGYGAAIPLAARISGANGQ